MKRVTIAIVCTFIVACAEHPQPATPSTIPSTSWTWPTQGSIDNREPAAIVIHHDTVERIHFRTGAYDHRVNGCASSRSTDMVEQLVKHGFTVEMIDGVSFAAIRPIIELIDPSLPDTEANVRIVGEKRSDAKEVYGTMGKWLTVTRGVAITFIVDVNRYGVALDPAGSDFYASARVSMIQRYHGEECTVAWTSNDGTRL